MAVFDEIAARDKLKIFDKGVDRKANFRDFEEFLSLRFGEEKVVPVDFEEPLKRECCHFLDCLKSGNAPLSDGRNGLEVIEVLWEAEKSLKVKT
jgi:hypothetical protein